MLVLQSQILFKEPAIDVENISLVGTENGYVLSHEFNTVREDMLDRNLNEIIEYAHRNKNPVKGVVIARDSNGNFHHIKLNRKGISKSNCAIKITVKNPSDKKKPLSFNDKMELLRKYTAEHDHLPDSTVTIDGCNLGTFVKKLGVDEEHVAEFAEIKKNMVKSAKRK